MKDLDVPDEVVTAKEYLKKSATSDGSNLYDYLSELINNALSERSKDAGDLVENYLGSKAKEKIKEIQNDSSKLAVAENQIKLFERANDDDSVEGGVENEEDFEIPLPNCVELAFFFEQAGIGLSREEMYRMFLSLKQLVFNYPLSSVRFWGKMFGTESNYIIAEVEYREGEGDDEENPERNNKKIKIKTKAKVTPSENPSCNIERCVKCGLRKRLENLNNNLHKQLDDEEEAVEETAEEDKEQGDAPKEDGELPKSQWKPPPIIPKEDHHLGTNKKVYFVCQEPGESWIKLPHVTPAEISAARQITKLMTGNLEAEINCYPPFPGKEVNYLRAQIARISSATQISPMGFFLFDDEEEEEEEEDQFHESYMENVDFESLPLRELIDSSMSGWVHHSRYILPQGRCSWFNPFEKAEDDFEEDELDDDEEENDNEMEPETGPQLLSSVANDTGMGSTPAWSTYTSSRVLPEYAIAVARSNRWPGAYAVARGKMFENLYVGWGQKYTGLSYAPPPPPISLEEYPEGPEVQEIDDPSVEEEQALKEKEEEAMKAAEGVDRLDDDEEEDDYE